MDLSGEIKRDIIPFTDPGSDVVLEDGWLLWRKDGVDQQAELKQAAALPTVSFNAGPPIPYEAFLASHHLADLRGLAEFILKTIPSEPYVETRARPTASDPSLSLSPTGESADGLITRLAGDGTYGSTRVILVQGPAGSGKTMALKHMTLARARAYCDGAAGSLFFYIDAQGRALSRLDDAMARDLQDLRSRFSYDAVPTLVRRGLLVPVIDGFDELLGSGGYDEAFSSLAAFISRLEGSGAVVASARSTFFDYKAFRENAARFASDGKLDYEIESVEIEPWDDVDANELVSKTAPQCTTEFRTLRNELSESERTLLQKPFYVSQVASLLAAGDTISSQDALLDQLVTAFLTREQKKLLDKEGAPLLDVDGHRQLLIMLADEMWWLETRRLDLETVRAAVELVLDELGAPPDSARRVIKRMPYYGLLRKSDTGVGDLQFEHETFHGYFLAEAFKQWIGGDRVDLRSFLSRSVLDEEVVDKVINLHQADVEACTDVAVRMCEVLRRGLGDSVARQNAGRFVARVVHVCGGLRDGTQLKNLYFDQEDFGQATLTKPRFQNCDFDRTDFSRLKMVQPEFQECRMQMPTVSRDGTRLEDADPALTTMLSGIRIVRNGDPGNESAETVYAPDRINAVLIRLGMRGERHGTTEPGYTQRQQERIRLLDRFLLRMQRRFYVAEEDFGRLGLAGEREWHTLYRLLKEYGITEELHRPMSGRNRPLVRLSYPVDLIRSGENTDDRSRPDIHHFWRELLNVD